MKNRKLRASCQEPFRPGPRHGDPRLGDTPVGGEAILPPGTHTLTFLLPGGDGPG